MSLTVKIYIIIIISSIWMCYRPTDTSAFDYIKCITLFVYDDCFKMFIDEKSYKIQESTQRKQLSTIYILFNQKFTFIFSKYSICDAPPQNESLLG